MKRYRITIDTGTTNTRTVLWDTNGKMLQEEKCPIGVKITAQEGSNRELKAAVKKCLDALLLKQGITYEDILYIVASGMITSNLGLIEVPHLTAPAGIKELAEGVYEKKLPDVAPVPISFIPGVKNNVSGKKIEALCHMDIMRGEETESIAVLEGLKEKPALLIMPGSHTKFIFTDERKRIIRCWTSMTGELLSFLILYSITSDAAGRQFISEETYDYSLIRFGCQEAGKEGFGRAAFGARIMNQFFIKEKAKVANYLTGIALESDMKVIKNIINSDFQKPEQIIITGETIMGQALYDLIIEAGIFSGVKRYKPSGEMTLSAHGAFSIMEKRYT